MVMETEKAYGIAYFIAGHYHVLFREGSTYRFHIITPPCDLIPEALSYYEARRFIESHPVCTNISNHEIRIMDFRDIQNIVLGKSPESTVKSLSLSSEEEEEEPLH